MTRPDPRGAESTRPVLLAGAFGQGNPGDEALLEAFRRALPGVPVLVTSSDPRDTEQRHRVPAVSSRSWRDVTRAVRASRALVFAGGTVFKALPPQTGRSRSSLLRNALAVSAYARAAGRPVCMIGVGVGDLPDGTCRTLARATARQADLLVLRDEASARELISVGVQPPLRVGADPAWTLLDTVPLLHTVPLLDTVLSSSEQIGDRVLVVPSQWAVAAAPAVLVSLAAALQPLLDAGLRVQVQPWQQGGIGHDDVSYAKQLAGRLTGAVEVLPVPRDLAEAAGRFAAARLVIAARFHALVAAAAAGTSILAVANEHKQAVLASRLAQPSVPVTATPDEMRAAVHVALSGPSPDRAAVQAEIAAAEEAFGLLQLLVSPGAVSAETISGLRLEPTW